MRKRKSAFGIILVCTSGLVALDMTVSATARADELPADHCAVRIPIAGFGELIEQVVRERLDGLPVSSTLTLQVRDSQTLVDLGADTQSGQDDELLVLVEVAMRPLWLAPFPSSFELGVRFRFLSRPPAGDGFTCQDPANPAQPLDFHYPNLVIAGTPQLYYPSFPWFSHDVDQDLDLHDVIFGLSLDFEAQGLTRCPFQTDVQDQVAEVLWADFPFSDLRIGDLVSDSGGFRINTDFIHILIPCLPVAQPPNGCDQGPTTCTFDQHGELGFLSTWMDMPRVISQDMEVNATAQLMGARVTCDHGVDCSDRGDADLDGFCDDVDKCPDDFGGSNCDLDGDQRGDSVLSTCPAALFSTLTGDELRLHTQRLCGGCDTCRGFWNLTQQRDPDTGVIISERQIDRDGDGLGDECDSDDDGDGIAGIYDCDDRNPYLGVDLDGDKFCDTLDPADEAACLAACSENEQIYNLEHGDTYQCTIRCRHADNCIYSTATADWNCSDLAACVAWGGVSCDEDDQRRCENQYHNPPVGGSVYQPDENGDGIGDKCQLGAAELEFDLNGTQTVLDCQSNQDGSTTCWIHMAYDRADISFRAWGGDCGTTSCTHETRTGVEVAACACDVGDPLSIEGWSDSCLEDYCPETSHWNQVLNMRAWHAVSAPEMDAKTVVAGPDGPLLARRYPVHPSSSRYQSILSRQLARDREVAFTRAEQVNRHWLTWPWPEHASLDDPASSIDLRADAHPGAYFTTRARVAWPDFPMPPVLDPDVILLSDEVPIVESAVRTVRIEPMRAMRPLDLFARRAVRGPLPAVGPDPSPLSAAGFALVGDPEFGVYLLHALARRVPRASRIWTVSFSGPALEVGAALEGTAALLDPAPAGLGAPSSSAGALVVYQEGVAGPVTGEQPPETGRLYLGWLGDDDQHLELHESAQLLGPAAEAPSLHDAEVLFLERSQQVLLLGHAVGGLEQGGLIAYRLPLSRGSWIGPFTVSPDPMPGFCARLDPVKGEVVLFDGLAPQGPAAYWLYPPTASLSRIGSDTAAPVDLARGRAGCAVATGEGALYVHGGARGDALLSDTWKLDLRRGTWERVDAGTSGGPDGLLEPLVVLQDERLWVAGAQADQQGAIALHGLEPDGSWLRTDLVRLGAADHWPRTGTVIGGRGETYRWSPSANAVWPGELVLASLQAAEGVLGLEARSAASALIGRGQVSGSGVAEMLYRCGPQPGCLMRVTRLSGGAPQRFALDARVATLVADGALDLRGSPRRLTRWRDELLVAVGPTGLRIIDVDTLRRLSRLQGRDIGGATSAARCGSLLCVTRQGRPSLVVVDLGDPSSPTVAGTARYLARGKDLASWGARVFVAHGRAGVARYDVSVPTAPELRDIVSLGGDRIVSVSVSAPRPVSTPPHRRLLAAAAAGGTVHLLDVDGLTAVPVGTFQAAGRLSRVRFKAGLLHVVGQHGQDVEVYDVSDPADPLLVGGYQDSGGELDAFYRGPYRYHLDGGNVVRQRAVVASP